MSDLELSIIATAVYRAFGDEPSSLRLKAVVDPSRPLSEVEWLSAGAPLLVPGVTGREWAYGWAKAADKASPEARVALANALNVKASALTQDAQTILRA